jgi:hypothetical protein
MTVTSPTFSQIKAQVAAIRKAVPNTRAVAIRSRTKWTGDIIQRDGEETYRIYQCDSPLAMRIALRNADESATTVLVTDIDDNDISNDIFVRLKPRKLYPLNSWQIVKALFQAKSIDPRIASHGWIAETLIEYIPVDGYAPVASGFLAAETVWPILFKRMIGLESESPDLVAVLKWSIDAQAVSRYQATSSAFKEAAIEWLVSSGGPAMATVLRCVGDNDRPDALPIGLAAGVVFHTKAKGKLERAIGKLEERYLCGQSVELPIVERWAAAATEVVRLQLRDSRLKQQQLNRSDEILRELQAEGFASLSDTSPVGFDGRLAEFGKQLTVLLKSGPAAEIEPLLECRQSIMQHDRHSRERRQLDRVDMAIRLVRFLKQCEANQSFSSMAEAAAFHLSEGGFVDWARLTLRSGDPVSELSEAYSKLFNAVTTVREQQSRAFAELLRDWTAAKTSDEIVVPVERILEQIVAPIAAELPVLVIVIDGMSVAVFRELMADVLGHDWLLLAEEAHGLRPALATTPSVTEVSRTSLLCGKLLQGTQDTERTGFAAHPALLKHCRANSPPILFHKAALRETDDASLAAEIRKEISSTHRKVVGVVVNAVDDHLLKGEQIDTRWSRDEIKVLPLLLHEARISGRTVIMVSDHGHVLDCNAKGQVFEGGERWRIDQGSPSDGEFRLKGPRVVIPEAGSLIAPWTEKIRYGIKKNGYHGGLSPQEMVIPIAVLTASGAFPSGWVEAPADLPTWWDVISTGPLIEPLREQVTRPVKPKEKPAGRLFDPEEEPAQPAAKTEVVLATPVVPDWVQALLASPVFAEQKRLGGRTVPTDEVFSKLLMAIDQRGGKITTAGLANSLRLSLVRLPGFIATAQRVLNVDGFLVLNRDDVSDTIALDRNLLCRQFDLPKGAK